MLQVLDHLGRKPDLTTYVKRLSGGKDWLDGRFLMKWDNADKAIEGEIEEGRKFQELFPEIANTFGSQESDSTDLSGLRKDLIRYHFKYRPHEKASFIYVRTD